MPGYYKLLPDDNIVEVNTYLEAYDGRDGYGPIHVSNTTIGEVRVSTVFLIHDHNFYPSHEETRPILFETMIFGGDYDQEMERYCTAQEAREGHARWVKLLTPEPPPKTVLMPLRGGKRRIKWK